MADTPDIPDTTEAELPPAPEFEVPLGGVFITGGPDGIGEVPWEEVAPPTPLEVAAGGPDSDPAVEFRRTLGRFATGVTVITVPVGDQVHGMTANAFMSVSLKPPLVLISVDKRAKMHRLLYEGMRFGVSVLSSDQDALSDHFAGRVGEALPEYRFATVHDTPLVEGAVAHVVASVVRSYWGGDHSLFLGQVEYARYGEGRPLLFHAGQYERLPLAQVSVFAGLPLDLQRAILAGGEERTFEEGQSVIGEGDEGDILFLLLDGTVRVERGGRQVTTLVAGDFFGEVSVLDGGPRTAAVVASTPARCVTVSGETLRQTLRAQPDVAWAMLQVVASRLREP
jgi:flavin reductase (DIM6/NTAB) family NADH-FMN oxidoreductase RutF